MSTRDHIEDFLSQKRLAVVGVSRDPQDFTRVVFREFAWRGYDVVPVNPNLSEVEGRTCYRLVQDISPPVDGALLMTQPRVTDQVVQDCAAAGIQRIWMHRASGQGAVSRSAIEFCEAHHMHVVPGECPFMFLPKTAFFHRLHGVIKKITGTYPH
ncbi:MAG TPA: CoA-binding protein [Bryobacteraceae bacterium]|nr:CoA-binding protein [Bryobacteraceae bacterium]